MRILFVNAVGNRGGAAKAARRIARAVQTLGHTVHFLTIPQGIVPIGDLDRKQSIAAGGNVAFRRVAERLPALLGNFSLRTAEYSAARPWLDQSSSIPNALFDVVNLHWVNYGQISPEGVAALKVPTVWSLHDMWAFTGGCHHSLDCERYTSNCGFCPILRSQKASDSSRGLWDRKRRAWEHARFRIVTPSTWLANRSRRSSLFRHVPTSVIPNPLDLTVFAPGDKTAARQRLGLPNDGPIVLFAAQRPFANRGKGYHLLSQSMRILSAERRYHLAVLGHPAATDEAFPVHHLGYRTRDEEIADAYRSADVFVLPSLYENLPNTIAEALACGVPAVAFAVGGIPDMIVPGQTGFLARPYDVSELADGIRSCVQAPAGELGSKARQKAVEMFDPKAVAQAYVQEFKQAALWRATDRLA
jgi:glycosyltransferase involved in cell wall biosynthesis